MSAQNRRFAWFLLLGLSVVLAVLVVPGMLRYTYQVSAGSKYADLMDIGVAPQIAKTHALRNGSICATLYFFAFPLPVLLLFNLLTAYITRLGVVRRYFLAWWASLLIGAFGCLFLTLSFAMWHNQSLPGTFMGALGIWIMILFLYYVLQVCAWAGCKLYYRQKST